MNGKRGPALIRAEGLTKIYPDTTVALEDLDLDVSRGEMVFIRGQSGAGKTTLFKLLMGIERASEGALFIEDESMDALGQRDLMQLRRKMGIIFQDFRLIKGRTARENVEMGMRVLGITGVTMRDRASTCLERLELSHRAEAFVESLSWGERQRLVTARALVRDPEIILADEPTGNLDPDLAKIVVDLLEAANGGGATVLVATHDSNVLDNAHCRIITLRRGRLISDRHPDGQGRGSR